METTPSAGSRPSETWDLSSIYASDAAWEADLARVRRLLEDAAAVKGALGASTAALATGLDTVMAARRATERVVVYATMRRDADATDPEAVAMHQRGLGLEELAMYDLFVPLVPASERHFAYGEAVDLVLEALRPLGATTSGRRRPLRNRDPGPGRPSAWPGRGSLKPDSRSSRGAS